MKTKDYGLASLMLCKGKKLISHAVDSRRQCWFEFEDDNILEKDFYTNDAMVRVQDFLNAQRMIKTMIYQTNENVNVERNRKFTY